MRSSWCRCSRWASTRRAHPCLCGPDAQSCLDAAGQGWLGAAGTLLLVAYMVGIAALVARLARGRSAPPLLWIVATAGLWAACGGQALLASALGAGAALGGGWVPLLAIGTAVGALLALALRVVPALARAWRLVAPRLIARPEMALFGATGHVRPLRTLVAALARDRAPPVIA